MSKTLRNGICRKHLLSGFNLFNYRSIQRKFTEKYEKQKDE